jgi:hypothetical protein
LIPDNAFGKEEDKLVERTYNKCRKILGLDEIKL